MVVFKNNISRCRKYRGISQEELASRAGISQPYLSKLERGEMVGSAEVRHKISTILQFAEVYLFASMSKLDGVIEDVKEATEYIENARFSGKDENSLIREYMEILQRIFTGRGLR